MTIKRLVLLPKKQRTHWIILKLLKNYLAFEPSKKWEVEKNTVNSIDSSSGQDRQKVKQGLFVQPQPPAS